MGDISMRRSGRHYNISDASACPEEVQNLVTSSEKQKDQKLKSKDQAG
jgi:hypothetical protein